MSVKKSREIDKLAAVEAATVCTVVLEEGIEGPDMVEFLVPQFINSIADELGSDMFGDFVGGKITGEDGMLGLLASPDNCGGIAGNDRICWWSNRGGEGGTPSGSVQGSGLDDANEVFSPCCRGSQESMNKDPMEGSEVLVNWLMGDAQKYGHCMVKSMVVSLGGWQVKSRW